VVGRGGFGAIFSDPFKPGRRSGAPLAAGSRKLFQTRNDHVNLMEFLPKFGEHMADCRRPRYLELEVANCNL